MITKQVEHTNKQERGLKLPFLGKKEERKMKDRKMNLVIMIVCIVAIGTVVVTKIAVKKDHIVSSDKSTVVEMGEDNTEELNIEQYLNGNTIKNMNPDADDNEEAFDVVDGYER